MCFYLKRAWFQQYSDVISSAHQLEQWASIGKQSEGFLFLKRFGALKDIYQFGELLCTLLPIESYDFDWVIQMAKNTTTKSPTTTGKKYRLMKNTNKWRYLVQYEPCIAYIELQWLCAMCVNVPCVCILINGYHQVE